MKFFPFFHPFPQDLVLWKTIVLHSLWENLWKTFGFTVENLLHSPFSHSPHGMSFPPLSHFTRLFPTLMPKKAVSFLF